MYRAATVFAEDMARQGYLSHESPGGGGAAERLEKAGYDWKSLAENIAWGQNSVADVLSAWLNSPSHCSALMEPKFRNVGLGCSNMGGRLYWALELAEPRR